MNDPQPTGAFVQQQLPHFPFEFNGTQLVSYDREHSEFSLQPEQKPKETEKHRRQRRKQRWKHASNRRHKQQKQWLTKNNKRLN